MSRTGDERLAAALRAEHAAIFGYGPIGAHLDGAALDLAAQADAAHRSRRDALLSRLPDKDDLAASAEPGYALPFPVTDRASALRLAISIEERTAAAWRAALPETAGKDRALALDSLTDLAVRAVRFRRAAGVAPAVVALPGTPA